ncbi:hypothetical protein ES708_13378 [subsurface metagenome]
MEIMTKEYCEACPWFNHALGYLEESDPYWETQKTRCACQDCTYRQECEATGPKDILTCLVLALSEHHVRVLKEHPEAFNRVKLLLLGKQRSGAER